MTYDSKQVLPVDGFKAPNYLGMITPADNDVLCGRSGKTLHHPGNVTYRNLVVEKKRDYVQKRYKKDKRQIAVNIVKQIRAQNPSGRFLSRDTDAEEGGEWHDIGDAKALEKTLQALREGAPKVRKELDEELAAAARKEAVESNNETRKYESCLGRDVRGNNSSREFSSSPKPFAMMSPIRTQGQHLRDEVPHTPTCAYCKCAYYVCACTNKSSYPNSSAVRASPSQAHSNHPMYQHPAPVYPYQYPYSHMYPYGAYDRVSGPPSRPSSEFCNVQREQESSSASARTSTSTTPEFDAAGESTAAIPDNSVAPPQPIATSTLPNSLPHQSSSTTYGYDEYPFDPHGYHHYYHR